MNAREKEPLLVNSIVQMKKLFPHFNFHHISLFHHGMLVLFLK